MALQLNISLQNNFDEISIFKNAYVKISRIDCDKTNGKAVTHILKEKEGKVLDSRAFEYPIKLDGDNFIKQAYLHLKTLPEFADAVDC
jgi:hypothetical protein